MYTMYLKFQLTRSRGAWRDYEPLISEKDWFQLTRSRGAWRGYTNPCKVCKWFQLTRSRGAWLPSPSVAADALDISTHTLTWSVTIADEIGWNWCQHFNSHAHVERDVIYMTMPKFTIIFQLTRSRGAWPKNQNAINPPTLISTHTLTWSVTCVRFQTIF